jgi:MipA family protein
LRSCTTSKGDKMNRIAWTGVLAASACLLLTATAASAEDASSTPGDPGGLTFLGWRLNHARVGLGMEPDYLGSNDYRVVPSGSLSFARRGGKAHLWSAPDDGFNVGLVSGDTLSAGLVGRWRSGRTDRNDLRGFDKIGGTVEAGGFVNWWPAEWLRVRGEARHGIGGHDSWSADLGADAVGRTGPWVLSVGPRLAWADKDFTATYFDVSPADAARSPFGLLPFASSGAYWSPGGLASAEYRFSHSWSVSAVGEYRRLTGDAANSPIVARLGSKNQFKATFSVIYAFGP